MITQSVKNENTCNEVNVSFVKAIVDLKISKLLADCNIRKNSRKLSGEESGAKRSAFEVFQFLLMIAFEGCNLYRFLGSRKQDIACSKSTYHRFLNDCHYNWRRFVTKLASHVIAYFDSLTCESRFKAFVLDDSVIGRSRSKTVELLAFIFDHVTGKKVKGFNLLLLGWTDSFSFVPVGFNMLSSAKGEKRINDIRKDIDKRTSGYKNRIAAVMNKPDAAIELIHNAVKAGITADCVLMDTWFTNEPFINRVLAEGLHVIGMLKDNKQRYYYGKRLLGLKELASTCARLCAPGDYLGSVVVRTRYYQIPVKIVFVRNRNKRSEYIVILSTDCTLSDEEIIRRYGCRWSIECCFKVSKSLLRLGKEFQPVNYDTTVSSTALVLTRFIILEWIRRKNSDEKTICELFFVCCEDVRDMEYSEALKQLLSIFVTGINNGDVTISENTRVELLGWYITQPAFIRTLCTDLMQEAGLIESVANHKPEKKSTVA